MSVVAMNEKAVLRLTREDAELLRRFVHLAIKEPTIWPDLDRVAEIDKKLIAILATLPTQTPAKARSPSTP